MKSLGTSLLLPLKDFLSKRAYEGRKVFNNFFFLTWQDLQSCYEESLKAVSLSKPSAAKLPDVAVYLKIKKQYDSDYRSIHYKKQL